MGRASRRKSERREKRRVALPPCSYQHCPSRHLPSTHIIQKKDGTFFAACEACVEPMMQAIKLSGMDAQVVTHAALKNLARAAKKKALGQGSVHDPAPPSP